MMRSIFIIICLSYYLIPSQLLAQDPHWQYVDFPYNFNTWYSNSVSVNILKGFEDTEADVVYLYDTFYTGDWNLDICNYNIARFDGVNYETIGNFGNEIREVTKFQDNLYACGLFECVNSNTNIGYLAKYNGDSWNSIGEFNGSVGAMVTDGNYLYVAGLFTQIDDQPMEGIARYDGTAWEALPAGGFLPNSSIRAICIFQGELYVGGILDIPGELGSERGLRVMRNDQWEAINGDQYIQNTTVHDLVIYHDKLYILGDFFFGGFSLNTSILVWDGESIMAPYPDFYDYYGNISYQSVPNVLLSTTDYLYAAGGFENIGDQEVNQLAAYGGNLWCPMYTEGLQAPIYGMFSLRDTIYSYLKLNPYSDTLYPTGLYKWIGGNDFENCSTPTGVENREYEKLQVFPNPINDIARIKGKFMDNSDYTLYDITGRAVRRGNTKAQQEFQIDGSALNSGTYFLKVNSGNRIFTAKILKR